MPKQTSTADVGRAAEKIRELELELAKARARLDALLMFLHEDGASIVELAREADLSRQSIYNALERAHAVARTGQLVWRDGDLVALKPGEPLPRRRRRSPPTAPGAR